MSEPERGRQGVQGPTGPQGIEGEGEKGKQGAQGERGKQGKPGTGGFSDQVTLSFVAVFLVSFTVLVVMGWQIYKTNTLVNENRHRIVQSDKRQIALCVLRVDLDKRIKESQNFLMEHPRGIPGITALVIRQSLTNSIITRRALQILDCNGGR